MISYMNHKSHKLFVGCDYYIEQRLCIFYNDNSCYCMNVRRERGYYGDGAQSNLTELEKIRHLTPNASQFIIYTNHSYINENVSNKYEAMVEFEMIHNIEQKWDDIKEIVVYEQRYES